MEKKKLTSQMLKELANKLCAGGGGTKILGVADSPQHLPRDNFRNILVKLHLLQLQPSEHAVPSHGDL